MTLPYDYNGQLVDTEYVLWVAPETQYGKAAETQFEISGNGYGSNVVIPKAENPVTTKPATETEEKKKDSHDFSIIDEWAPDLDELKKELENDEE